MRHNAGYQNVKLPGCLILKEFIPAGEFKNEEICAAIEWYIESKNFYLERAISFRSPLSIDQSREMRLAYSNYFISLMAGIEVLLESKYRFKNEFRTVLFDSLSTSDYSGENCYNYLRELRNAITHRGYDVCCYVRGIGDFPIPIAPNEIPNRSGSISYKAFGDTILDIIRKVEDVIGDLIFKHLDEHNLFEPTYTHEEGMQKFREILPKIEHIPDWVKDILPGMLDNIPREAGMAERVLRIKSLLEFNALATR